MSKSEEKVVSPDGPGVSVPCWRKGVQNQDDWISADWQMTQSLSGREGLDLLPDVNPAELDEVIDAYPFKATPFYLSLIDWDDPEDPIRKQVVPDAREGYPVDGDTSDDPFDERRLMPVPGLVRRYPDRALIVVTSRCAVFCRHCTRKNLLGSSQSLTCPTDAAPIMAYLERTPSIREVILSGGDPLVIERSLLEWLLGALREIGHVEVIRIGTRVPVVLPMLLDEEMASMIAAHRPIWVNTQFNHSREVTAEAVAACDRLIRKGVPVSNQAVLLKGVNDSVEEMARLCNRLQQHMIRPYYVFHCDPVSGTSHFHTDLADDAGMAERLRKGLGGLALPRFVADMAGEGGKLPVDKAALQSGRFHRTQ